jgi:hypothetical protein
MVGLLRGSYRANVNITDSYKHRAPNGAGCGQLNAREFHMNDEMWSGHGLSRSLRKNEVDMFLGGEALRPIILPFPAA